MGVGSDDVEAPPPPPGSVSIVQDHIVQRGGGERVLLSMAKALRGAPIHTSFFWPEETYREFGELDVRPSNADRVPGLRRHHRAALPLMPLIFGRLRIDTPVVVCGTSGWAAGVRTSGRKLLYFHALARWLHERDAYVVGMGSVARSGLRVLDRPLRRWDQRAVDSADRMFVYSSAMGDVVERVYGRRPEVLPPPVVIDPDGPGKPVAGVDPGFFLCPCRLMAYKNVHVLLEAFAAMPTERLVVAGDGPDGARLRSLAPANVRFVGAVGDAEMRWLYRSSVAAVSAAFEPFGLITLEANAFGRRAVVLRAGGFCDTVVENVTGVFFDDLSAVAVGDAIGRVQALPRAESSRLRAHVEQWSEGAFVDRLRRIVAEEMT